MQATDSRDSQADPNRSEASAQPSARLDEAPTPGRRLVIDGNEAAALVAHRTSEVIAIYPITPSSAMAELADAWSAVGQQNIWGSVPRVVQMQSEGGAAGAAHGALLAGSVTTTFTASQGLLLMIPNMYKIAGELVPAVFHVAARSVATHALSIFGDHSDVMATRSTGWGILSSSSVQEAHDFALISLASTLRSRVPMVHFFDGFRTSHEVNTIEEISEDIIRVMIPEDLVLAHRRRGLDPERPVLKGSAQNPDVFFQSREAANPFFASAPAIVAAEMRRFAELTGRHYSLFDYYGHPKADRVLVLMGSGSGAATEAVDELNSRGEKVGLMRVRLYRPFSTQDFLDSLPGTVRGIAVLDRTKEPGAPGEPLYQDVVMATTQRLRSGQGARGRRTPVVIGGRYGLGSKEFTPAMAAAALSELATESPRDGFTVGIEDDVSRSHLTPLSGFGTEPARRRNAVFFGLGSDGTVGANKNTVKIVGEHTPLYAQGYFVYDSKKAGAVTVSHLRFDSEPICSTYLIESADFVGCHQFGLLEKRDVLGLAAEGATFLLNSPYGPDGTWDRLPQVVQEQIIAKNLRLFVIDASKTAREAGLGNRVNTVLQPCFLVLSGVLPEEEAIAAVKDAIRRTYGKRGELVLERNFEAVDMALDALSEVDVPDHADSGLLLPPPVPADAPDFVREVTGPMIAGLGDSLPVSAFPPDGTFPVGTARWERRGIAHEVPVWDPEICIECAKCALVCPHAAVRMKVFRREGLGDPPDGFLSRDWSGRDFPEHALAIQVAPDDCTGCGICVEVCPARSRSAVRHKALNMESREPILGRERENYAFFQTIPPMDRAVARPETLKGSQMMEPLFEFSGACAGCGETPYLKLLTQLFGDRMVVANATGCSSIYGGNLPTTPWAANEHGQGPAWANSLFEDNAEFGLGMRLSIDQHVTLARSLLQRLAAQVGPDLAGAILRAPQIQESELQEQRERIALLERRLAPLLPSSAEARQLASLTNHFIRRSVWIIGGDGWAYDIGFGGLDHVLASGRDVNILVLDTEVYSNTGGQSSKATPRSAIAKFAAAGKHLGKKDLGMIASAYGNVYVASIAMGADNAQTVRALVEAEAHPGPSLVLAYSHCIAHGIDMRAGMTHQKLAVDSGHWPLYRYRPTAEGGADPPFHLDSRPPKIPFRDFALREARFAMLMRSNPAEAERLLDAAQRDIDERRHLYEQIAGVERVAPEILEDIEGVLEEEGEEG
ncbi:MAG: pyruvate:ferredoxin (flavodoxin) oxidoreductase [Dehalococcoidia bacterium]